MKRKIALILSILMITCFCIGALAACSPTGDVKVENYTVGNGKSLKVGIISDTQLNGNGIKDKYYYNYLSALTTLKNENVDTIMFAGDISDVMTKEMPKPAAEAWSTVFGGMDQGPIRNYIMGNHDYWLPAFFDCWDIPDTGKMQKRFKEATGENAYSHKVINGYHFINCSPENGNMSGAYTGVIDWLKEQIKIAEADGDKPIFVQTHQSPYGTVCMSATSDGDKELYDALVDHPRVINIAGHSHASLRDPRSIWQGAFTAIQTQSLSYTCYEGSYENSSDYEGLPMGMIMELSDDNVSVSRIDALTGERLGDAWIWNAKTENTKYAFDNVSANVSEPEFRNTVVDVLKYNGVTYFKFDQAVVEKASAVLSYKMEVYKDGKIVNFKVNDVMSDSLMYLSDYFVKTPSDTALLEFKRSLEPGAYSIKIYAIEAYGKISKPLEFDCVI